MFLIIPLRFSDCKFFYSSRQRLCGSPPLLCGSLWFPAAVLWLPVRRCAVPPARMCSPRRRARGAWACAIFAQGLSHFETVRRIKKYPARLAGREKRIRFYAGVAPSGAALFFAGGVGVGRRRRDESSESAVYRVIFENFS